MKINKWTAGLAAVGLVSLASVVQAEETTTPLLTALSSTVISGYVDTSAQWNPGTGNANPAPYSFNQGKQDGFNLNVVGLTLEKPMDESEWASGYKVDLLFGPDAVGYNPSANATDNSTDFAVKQAYVALRAPIGNGIDVKLGVFDSILGYESFESYKDPNYTRSYGYTIAPTEHTGILASYQFCDVLSASAGVANTLSAGINQRDTYSRAESTKTYMGSVTLTAPESMGSLAGSALYAGIVKGWANSGSDNDQSAYYVGATIATPVTGWKIGVAYDHLSDSGSGTNSSNYGYAQAFAIYNSVQVTEKLSIHGRGEQAKSSNGTIHALTGTIQYDLWQNVISRLEVRWDHSDKEIFGGTNQGLKSDGISGGAHLKNTVMIAANLVYKF